MPGQEQRSRILGLGLDGADGHTRVTRGENFHLLGGAAETHQRMQEQCIKFNEKLSRRGKTLESAEPQELTDIAAECEMNLLTPKQTRRRRQS